MVYFCDFLHNINSFYNHDFNEVICQNGEQEESVENQIYKNWFQQLQQILCK